METICYTVWSPVCLGMGYKLGGNTGLFLSGNAYIPNIIHVVCLEHRKDTTFFFLNLSYVTQIKERKNKKCVYTSRGGTL